MVIGAEAGAIERLMAYRRSGTKKGPGLLARLIDLVMWKKLAGYPKVFERIV